MEWQSCFPQSRFILILSDEEELCARRLLESGAAGCLLREEMPEQFTQAVATIVQDNTWFKPSLVQRALQTDTKPFMPGDPLTEREIAALRLVAADKSNPEIATTLHLSPRTVGDILGSIYAKLGVRTRAGAVAKAFQLGLLEN
jgi:DNA-binding NarL/FixJ family response regulator